MIPDDIVLRAAQSIPLVLLIVSQGESGLMKFVSPGAPAWFVEKFANTWIGRLPVPMAVHWWALALAEVAVAGLAVGAIAVGPSSGLGDGAMLLGAAVYAALSLGLRVSGDFVGAFQTFVYAGITLGLWAALLR